MTTPKKPTTPKNRDASYSQSWKRIAWPVGGMLFFLVIWEMACLALQIKPYLLPAPHIIAKAFLVALPEIVVATAVTLWEALCGFVIASVVGFALGCLFAHSEAAERSIYPYVISLKAVPIIAIAPVLVMWFGDDLVGKVVMAAIVAFFPIVVNTTIGLRAVDEEALLLMKAYSASQWHIFTKLRLQTSVPYVFSALKVASTMSVLGAIVAEFVGSKQGIGFKILLATYHLDTPQLFAAILATALTSIGLFALLSWTEGKVLQRYRFFHSKRTDSRSRETAATHDIFGVETKRNKGTGGMK